MSHPRELARAQQILEDADQYGKASRLKNTCVFGGAPKGLQLRNIENGELWWPSFSHDVYDLMK